MRKLTSKLLEPLYNGRTQNLISQSQNEVSDSVLPRNECADTQQDDSWTLLDEIKPKKLSAVRLASHCPMVQMTNKTVVREAGETRYDIELSDSS